MPIQYSSIIEEHQATRERATLFDVSHMARIHLKGPEAEQFIDGLTTRQIKGIGPGKIRYSLLCNAQGGILDDILVYRLPDATDEFLWVVNASNRDKILEWIGTQRSGFQFELNDRTMETAMIAFQGPLAVGLTKQILGIELDELKYFSCQNVDLDGQSVLVSRTGYTGEDGCELVLSNSTALDIWQRLAEAEQVSAAGLGARDTLRLEAAMPLYGHELSEDINPVQTGLDFAISLKDRDFVGKSAIEGALSDSNLHVRIGLILDGKRAAREGAPILLDDQSVGLVTSGTYSPTMQKSIAMGYIDRKYAIPGGQLVVDIRGKKIDATITELPFYKRTS